MDEDKTEVELALELAVMRRQIAELKEEVLRPSEERLRLANKELADYSRNLEQKVAECTLEIDLAVAFSDQAALAIENTQLRQRVEQAAVLEERARLARELHDSVTQSLYSSTFFAAAGRELAEADDLAGALYGRQVLSL